MAITAPQRVTDSAEVLLAPNPGPMTLDGTNSYLLTGEGARNRVVVDPGPADTGHLTALAGQGPVELILITHRHHDHTDGAPELARLTRAPVRALDPAFCIGGAPLTDGETIHAAGLQIAVLATPGHTDDSVYDRTCIGRKHA
jgi:glyoxylase-like metal-dependent hydrolase (beta-lactamase superfamily II)